MQMQPTYGAIATTMEALVLWYPSIILPPKIDFSHRQYPFKYGANVSTRHAVNVDDILPRNAKSITRIIMVKKAVESRVNDYRIVHLYIIVCEAA